MSNDKFVKLYKCFFDLNNNDYLLSPKEMLTYISMMTQRTFRTKEHIYYQSILDDFNKKNTKSNIEEVIGYLKNLESKNLITIVNQDKIRMTLEFHEPQLDIKENQHLTNGFKKIYYEEFEVVLERTNHNIHQIYIYLLIRGRVNTNGEIALSYSLMSKLAQNSTTTCQKAIKKLYKNDLIVILSSSTLRKMNVYATCLVDIHGVVKGSPTHKKSNEEENFDNKSKREVRGKNSKIVNIFQPNEKEEDINYVDYF